MSANQLALAFVQVQPFDPRSAAVAPSKEAIARENSALAAIENTATSRRAKQATTLLLLIRAAGETGISDLELHRATGIPRQSICVRRFDLRSLLEPSGDRFTDPISGRSYTKWRLKQSCAVVKLAERSSADNT